MGSSDSRPSVDELLDRIDEGDVAAVEEVWNLLDKDGGGQLEGGEFNRCIKEVSESLLEGWGDMSADKKDRLGRVMIPFFVRGKLDRNRDQSITKDEFTQQIVNLLNADDPTADPTHPKMPAPKRPLSAYFLYAGDHRRALMDEGLKVTEVGKKLGEQWKALSDAEKAPYATKAEGLKKQYEQDLAEYKANKGDDSDSDDAPGKRKKKGKKGQKKAKKDPNAPKRPLSAYFLWMADNRERVKASNPDLDHKQLLSEMGSQWNAASDSEKAKYQKKNEQAKKDYEKAVQKYKASQNDDDDEDDESDE